MYAQRKANLFVLIVVLSLILTQSITTRSQGEYQVFLPMLPNYSVAPSVGELDPTFDGDGIVVSGPSSADGVVLQPDGKILVAGEDFLLRFNPDGSQDTSFNAGVTVPPFSSYDLMLQDDGKIVRGGVIYINSITDFALVRHNPDGSLDTSFDGDGWLTTDINKGDDYGRSVTLQPDGQILLGGTEYPDIYQSDFALARYNPDGSLDPNFGTNGIVLTDFGFYEYLESLALQSDGKILAVGNMKTIYDDHDFALARYNPDGSLDTSFDGDGLVTTDFFGDQDIARDVLLQPDGKIVVAGEADKYGVAVYEPSFALARYNPDGSLDTSFGSESGGDGKVATYCTGYGGHGMALALQPDGKILLAGNAIIALGYMGMETHEIVLLRYNPDGSLDTSFDGDGWLTFGFDGESVSANAIALQPDGKIVLAGSSTGDNLVLLRFK